MNKRAILFLCIFAGSAWTFGCELREVRSYGEECSPTIISSETEDYFATGYIRCFKYHMESDNSCFNAETNTCYPDASCEECAGFVADCKRYQADFDVLKANALQETERKYVSKVNDSPNLTPYYLRAGDSDLRVCPAIYGKCVWNQGATLENLEFECIPTCAKTICGTDCIDLSEDSKFHCGACGNACLDNQDCISGRCVDRSVKEECGASQYYDPVNGKCTPFDLTHCGIADGALQNCTRLRGWANGECDIEKGRCVATECVKGFHLDANDVCIEDSESCCGRDCVSCLEFEVCSNGVCADDCEAPLVKCVQNESVYCANLFSSAANCGDCGIECTPNQIADSLDVACQNAQCVAVSCNEGFHLTPAGACIRADTENCTAFGKPCSAEIQGWVSGICEAKTCIATECASGYRFTNGRCEAESTDCCGESCTKCQALEACKEGECQSLCEPGQQPCYNTTPPSCVNILTNGENCGACGRICHEGSYCSNGECQSKCSQTECGNSCVDLQTNMDHCGACDARCHTDNVAFSSKVTCSEGVCLALGCDASVAYFDNGQCIQNTVEHCGSATNTCRTEHATNTCETINGVPQCQFECLPGFTQTSDGKRCESLEYCGSQDCTALAGWKDGSCKDGVCSILSCQSNYILTYNASTKRQECVKCDKTICASQCVDTTSDNDNCGTCGKSCSDIPEAVSATCQNGKCQASSCLSGYHLYDGECEADSKENCGSHGKECIKTPNALLMDCQDGLCITKTCKLGYELSGNFCVEKKNKCAANHYDCYGDGSRCCPSQAECKSSSGLEKCIMSAIDTEEIELEFP